MTTSPSPKVSDEAVEAAARAKRIIESIKYEYLISTNPDHYATGGGLFGEDWQFVVQRLTAALPHLTACGGEGWHELIEELASAYEGHVLGISVSNPKELKGAIRLEFRFRHRDQAHRVLNAIEALVNRARPPLPAAPTPEASRG